MIGKFSGIGVNVHVKQIYSPVIVWDEKN